MPETLSPEAQDLIKCILNTDPIKRIKLFEIKQHPWVLNNLQPRDWQTDTWSKDLLPKATEVDEEVLVEIMKHNFAFKGKTMEQVVAAIRQNTNDDFVVAYNLKRDEKYKENLDVMLRNTVQSKPN